MSKDSFYFSHDYNARSDPKIKTMLAKLGMAAYGIYWAIIEDLYNNANALPLQYDVISYDLRVEEKIVKSIICDFELFVFKDGIFSSLSVQRRLEERAAKSNAAKESANIRWAKVNANALQSQSERYAIKERKGKEKKENNNWRTNFDIYLDELSNAVEEICNDAEWISEQEKYNPNVDIPATIRKSVAVYWGVETEGYANKKKTKGNNINWKTTFAKNMDKNKVYKPFKKVVDSSDIIFNASDKKSTEWKEI